MKGIINEFDADGVTVQLLSGRTRTFPAQSLSPGLRINFAARSILNARVAYIGPSSSDVEIVEDIPSKLQRIAWPDRFEVAQCYKTETYHGTRPEESLEDDIRLARSAGRQDWEISYQVDGSVRSWGMFEPSREGVFAMLAGMITWFGVNPNMWIDETSNVAYVFIPENSGARNGVRHGLWDRAAQLLGYKRLQFVSCYTERVFGVGVVGDELCLFKGSVIVDLQCVARSEKDEWLPVSANEYSQLPDGGWSAAQYSLRPIKDLPAWAEAGRKSLIAQFLLALYNNKEGKRTFSPVALGTLPAMPVTGDLDTALANACVAATANHVHVREYGITLFCRQVAGQTQQFVCGYAVVGEQGTAVQVEILDVYPEIMRKRPDGSPVMVVALNMRPFGLGLEKVYVEYTHDPRYRLLRDGLYLIGPKSTDADLDHAWAGYAEKQAVK